MSRVESAAGRRFEASVPIAIVGGGACGLVAALAAREVGVEALVLERDALPSGSTALSSGLVPAAATRWQQEKGIADSPASFAADIARKNKGGADAAMVEFVARAAGPAIEWLADRHDVPFGLIEGFSYPGHSVLRMHGTPRRTGRELMDFLLAAAGRAGVELVTSAHVTTVHADGGRVVGIGLERPDGAREEIGCDALILACNGYGGSKELVRRFIPEMSDALYFGHPGNQGDALSWGEGLGGVGLDLGAYQGHGSVAEPHGILITWALMTGGGIQVNTEGRRFSNELRGYSEQAVDVLAQPGGVAFDIYDARCEAAALQFEDYRQAREAGAVKEANSVDGLAEALGLPAKSLSSTLIEIESGKPDLFGRDFSKTRRLGSPYRGVRVTGALFHTQGGLAVDTDGRVLRRDGTPLENLFAGGGAARGVSGATVAGYLSGNGLLTAVTLGRAAGMAAARRVSGGAAPRSRG